MTALTRWQPFREVASLQERVNQLFSDFFPASDLLEPFSLAETGFSPKTDVYEKNDQLVVEMEVPGMRPEDLNISVEGNALTISGERKTETDRKEGQFHRTERSWGQFSRSFTLPTTVDPATVEARYDNGVLHVCMTKKPGSRPRQIKITETKKQLPSKAA